MNELTTKLTSGDYNNAGYNPEDDVTGIPTAPFYYQSPAQPPCYAVIGYFVVNISTGQPAARNLSPAVVTQPAPATIQHVSNVEYHMGLAMFACLCCVFPLGLAVILKVTQSRAAMERGDVISAKAKSRQAFWFCLISIISGVLIIIIDIVAYTI